MFVLLIIASFFSTQLYTFPASGTQQPKNSTLGNWPPALSGIFGPEATNPRIQFGLSFWTISDFTTLTNGCYTVACFSDAIQNYLLPHDIYWVPIYQYEDANVSSTCVASLCPQQEVRNLLTAGDQYGMHFLFWFPTWGFDGGGEPTCATSSGWQGEVLKHWSPSNPSTIAEVSSTGATVCVLRQDYVNLWEKQLDADVHELYRDYGSHPSFAGFLQYWEFSVGYSGYDNTGYSVQTQLNFSRSQFASSGCLQCYLQYEFQAVLLNVAKYCQSLITNCIIMSDEGPRVPGSSANAGFVSYQGYSLAGGSGGGFCTGIDTSGWGCIGSGTTTESYPFEYQSSGVPGQYPYSPYVAGEAIGFRCYPGSHGGWTCNNGGWNTVGAVPFQLTASYPNQPTPLVWIMTSACSLMASCTGDAGNAGNSDIPLLTGTTPGTDYLYNERYFASIASNTVYLGREAGYSANPLANILYVNTNPSDEFNGGATNFLSPQFLQNIGFNVTTTSVAEVKRFNLLKFNAIIWTSTDQPDESNFTT
jgi:hypothetical protein